MHNLIKYVHLELLYELSFKSLNPYITTLELASWSRSYFSSDMILISLYIKRRNKDGALIREQRSFE